MFTIVELLTGVMAGVLVGIVIAVAWNIEALRNIKKSRDFYSNLLDLYRKEVDDARARFKNLLKLANDSLACARLYKTQLDELRNGAELTDKST